MADHPRGSRVLRSGGRIGVIDNTLFSLVEVLWASILTFAERPDALAHATRLWFLPTGWVLATLMRAYGFAIVGSFDGSKTYHVLDGQTAVARLIATGAAAGFEFASYQEHHDEVFARFAEILENRYMTDRGVPITHRYLVVIGRKP